MTVLCRKHLCFRRELARSTLRGSSALVAEHVKYRPPVSGTIELRSLQQLVFVGVLALLGFSTSLDIEGVIPSQFEIEDSINRTIEEVEKLVQENPNLPKLSRDNIVDMLYNITSKDMMSIEEKAQKAIERTRENYQRALMVVLPHKPQQTGESLTELFTKPPIVKLVPDEIPITKDSFVQTSYNTRKSQEPENTIDNKHQVVKAHMRFLESGEVTSDPTEEWSPTQRDTKIVTTNVPATTMPATTIRATTVPATTIAPTTGPATTVPATTIPEITVPFTKLPISRKTTMKNFQFYPDPTFSTATIPPKTVQPTKLTTTTKPTMKNFRFFPDKVTKSESDRLRLNLQLPDLKAEASHNSAATKRPVYKGSFSRYRTSTTSPQKLGITDRTTPKMKTLLFANMDTAEESKVEKTTTSNNLGKDEMQSDQWNYRVPQTTRSTTTRPESYTLKNEPVAPTKKFFLPTIETSSDQTFNQGANRFKNLARTTTPSTTITTTVKPSPIFVTPEVVSNQQMPQGDLRATSTTISPTSMRAEIKQLLKSIGLQPMKPTESQIGQGLSLDSVDALLKAQSIDSDQISRLKYPDTNSKKVNENNSFETPPPEIKHGVKNLSPDIQLLFQQFGLQNTGQENLIQEATTAKTTTTPKPTRRPVDASSYTRFKPLPTSQVKDKDFRDFLARFGLGVGDNRNQKAVQPRPTKKQPSTLLDAIPGNMKKVLENVGLIKRTPKSGPEGQFEVFTQKPRAIEQVAPTTEHVFKPENAGADKQQTEKIRTLLNTVRMVQQGKADVQDVQKVAHELLESTKTLGSGPDPIKLEEILNNYRDNLKNEVKRQQENMTTTSTTTTTTTTESTLTDLERDELTVPTSATTDTSSESPKAKAKPASDQSSSSSDAKEKSTAKPSFFDTFDPDAFLKNVTTESSTSSTSSTAKPNFFDTFDPDAFLKNATAGAGGKDEAGPSPGELEESFGGGSTEEPDPEVPTRPKTGLYFLVDWNSFLKVGSDDDKDLVNLSFSPKVLRNRHRFIPIDLVQRNRNE
ncbi:hypothetical protein QAD02_010320 [Eretmocerus hayati]|uniref:Uncharacterized protein n=1 Tax=Eretmocerus hayati TaxID=131215 RepID=A0ACC2NBX8_9HYME|nr:hypothetical protein QAD02_010320 [Eretmocerus hayati]